MYLYLCNCLYNRKIKRKTQREREIDGKDFVNQNAEKFVKKTIKQNFEKKNKFLSPRKILKCKI